MACVVAHDRTLRLLLFSIFILMVSTQNTNGTAAQNNDNTTNSDVTTEVPVVNLVTDQSDNSSAIQLPTQIIPEDVVLETKETQTLRVIMNLTGLDINYTDIHVRAQIGNYDIAAIASNLSVIQPEVDVAEADITIAGSATVGTTELILTQYVTSNGTDVRIQEIAVTVTVQRTADNARTQIILEYVSMSLGMLLMVFLGCSSTVYDLRRSWAWILATLAIQIIVVPLVCWIFVELFYIHEYKKIGVMAASYCPVGLAFTAFSVTMTANASVTSALLILNYLLANAFIPMWSLQLDEFAEVIGGTDTPFAAINSTLVIALVLFITGQLLEHFTPLIAEDMRKFSKYLACLTLIFTVVASFRGGADMLLSLGWKEILLCILWPLLFMGLTSLYFCCCRETGARFRSSALFILTKGFYMPGLLISSAFGHPASDVAEVTSYFFSLMTLVFGLTLTLIHVCFTHCSGETDDDDDIKEHNEERRLVINEHAMRYMSPPPSYDDASSEVSTRNAFLKEVVMLGMSDAATTSASFGAPALGV